MLPRAGFSDLSDQDARATCAHHIDQRRRRDAGRERYRGTAHARVAAVVAVENRLMPAELSRTTKMTQ